MIRKIFQLILFRQRLFSFDGCCFLDDAATLIRHDFAITLPRHAGYATPASHFAAFADAAAAAIAPFSPALPPQLTLTPMLLPPRR